jgi:sterol desaturase/sphingolipid hydroxylase (fatty acid hydroxylase superfamily)
MATIQTTETALKRDARGEWRPADALKPIPLFVWPPRPIALGRWLLGYPGHVLPWLLFYALLATLTWRFLTPDWTRMRTLEPAWIVLLLIRNLAVVSVITGLWHLRLFVQRAQGTDYKYNGRWLSRNNPTFLFGDQVRDNIFWTMLSAVPIWTAYEVFMLWAFASGYLHPVDWRAHWFYCVLLALTFPVWQELHFYFVHRLIHWAPLYRWVHYLHHKNINPGPWSGLAMHPVEHLLYFSGVLIFWIVPSHPFHSIFLLQITALVPSQGHAGFERLVFNKQTTIPASDFFHYLHHKYVECNYGAERVPFDRWFGTFHDGTKASQDAMQKRLQARRGAR